MQWMTVYTCTHARAHTRAHARTHTQTYSSWSGVRWNRIIFVCSHVEIVEHNANTPECRGCIGHIHQSEQSAVTWNGLMFELWLLKMWRQKGRRISFKLIAPIASILFIWINTTYDQINTHYQQCLSIEIRLFTKGKLAPETTNGGHSDSPYQPDTISEIVSEDGKSTDLPMILSRYRI
jgi:hypothetical protein